MHEHIYKGSFNMELGIGLPSPVAFFYSAFLDTIMLCLKFWMLLFGLVTDLYITTRITTLRTKFIYA